MTKERPLEEWESYYKAWLEIEPKKIDSEYMAWFVEARLIEEYLVRHNSKLPMKILAMGRRWNGKEWVK